MKRILMLALFLLAGHLGVGQGVSYRSTVFISGGFPFATIRVCSEPASGTPCTPLATVYSDPGLTLPLVQPFTSDANGNFSFFGSPAVTYHVQVSGNGLATYDIPYITLPGGGTASGVTSVGFGVPTGFVSSGGPVTGAGTLNLGMPAGWAVGSLLVGTGSNSVGVIPVGATGQCLIVAAATWTAGACPGGVGGTPGQIQWNNAGVLGGFGSYDGVSTLSLVNLMITGTLTVAGVYQVLNSPNPGSALGCPATGLTNFGVNLDHFLAECIGGSMAASADLVYITNGTSPDQGYPCVGAVGSNPGVTCTPQSVDLYATYGSTDFCASLAAGKTAHLNDGVTLDGRAFGQQGNAIKCGSSTYVAGYYGTILLPGGTINVQNPNNFFMQTHSDMIGQSEDSTIIKACVSGNANCGGVFFPTGATTPTYPVACWTDDGLTCNYNANPTFDTRLEKVSIDCSSNAGTFGLANFVAQENESGPHFVSIHGCGNHGAGYMYGGASLIVAAGSPLQTNSTSSSASCSNCTVSMPSANVAGDTIPTCGMWKTSAGSPSLSSISDGTGNPYTLISGSLGTDGLFSMECGYSQNVNAAPAGNTVHYNFSGNTASYDALMVVEHKNIISLGSLDQVAVATVTTPNPACPSITPTQNNELIICAVEAEATGATFAAGGAGGTLDIGTAIQGWQHFVQGTAAAIALNWTSATSRRAIVVSMSFIPGTNNGPGSQNHVVEGLDVYIGNGETATADSKLIWGDTGAIGIAGPKEVRDVTATVNNGFTGTAPTELVRVCGTATTFDNIHLENWQGASSYGFGLGEDCGFTGITINNLNAGNAAGSTGYLLYLSNLFPSNNSIITNLNEVGPNFSTGLLNDALNGNVILTANESKLALYPISTNGCRFSGSGSGQCIPHTSGAFPFTLGVADLQGIYTDYNAACQFGDCQSGAASQYPAMFGYTTIPVGFTQMVVSSKSVTSNQSHVMIQDDPGAVGYFGGFPSTCNTTQFLNFKVLAKQGWSTSAPYMPETYVAHTTLAVTSSSFTSNTVTLLMASTSGLAVGNIIRHAGDSSATGGPYGTGMNTLGWITAITPNVSISYGLTYGSAITAGTGGTVQIVEGFVVGTSTAVTTNSECLSFTIFD